MQRELVLPEIRKSPVTAGAFRSRALKSQLRQPERRSDGWLSAESGRRDGDSVRFSAGSAYSTCEPRILGLKSESAAPERQVYGIAPRNSDRGWLNSQQGWVESGFDPLNIDPDRVESSLERTALARDWMKVVREWPNFPLAAWIAGTKWGSPDLAWEIAAQEIQVLDLDGRFLLVDRRALKREREISARDRKRSDLGWPALRRRRRILAQPWEIGAPEWRIRGPPMARSTARAPRKSHPPVGMTPTA